MHKRQCEIDSALIGLIKPETDAYCISAYIRHIITLWVKYSKNMLHLSHNIEFPTLFNSTILILTIDNLI